MKNPQKIVKILEIIAKYLFGIIFIILLLGVFYWFSYRPAMIEKDCHEEAVQQSKDALSKKDELDIINSESFIDDIHILDNGAYLRSDYEEYFNHCLRANGI